jgi:patatin-like phospholipase/acyl hydrolase
MKKIRILSLDGGGIRGIIPGVILQYIESQLQTIDHSEKKIGDYFDLIAGTSTGGILACAYLVPGENGMAKYSTTEALSLYLKEGSGIFHNNLLRDLKSVFGMWRTKYDVLPLEKDLLNFFKETTLAACIKPSLITSYDMVNRKAWFFTSADAINTGNDFLLRDVARATSAAPTYFRPAHIKRVKSGAISIPTKDNISDNHVLTLIDGGVYANNPAMCAYAEARKTFFSTILKDPLKPDQPSAKDMLMISIGTGSIEKPYSYSQMKNAGELKWLEPILDMLMSSNSETVGYELKQMYGTLDLVDSNDYYRLEPGLFGASQQMDDATPSNLNLLKNAGLSYISENKTTLDSIVQKILLNK